MKPESCMLAHNYDKSKHSIGGWFCSIKLDGIRCLWDGGASRGKLCSEVPYANILKDGRYVNVPIATGLWTRYLKPIYAPSWFLDMLPVGLTLDGELWGGVGGFQSTVSTVKTLIPDSESWSQINYMVFDSPAPAMLFGDRTINVTNLKIRFYGCYQYWLRNVAKLWKTFTDFQRTYEYLERELVCNSNLLLHKQQQLSLYPSIAETEMTMLLDSVSNSGGEGLILRRAASMWVPERSHNLLKVKRLHDMEGVVVGYRWGRETDKGSKLLGMMGAITLKLPSGVVFDLSGFTDDERTMVRVSDGDNLSAVESGVLCPGEVVSDEFGARDFVRGSRITFRYRELSDSGCPKEAKYLRKHAC